jgi:hypothetical protein
VQNKTKQQTKRNKKRNKTQTFPGKLGGLSISAAVQYYRPQRTVDRGRCADRMVAAKPPPLVEEVEVVHDLPADLKRELGEANLVPLPDVV